MSTDSENIELTILMPCLNEAETIETCIAKAFEFLKTNHIKGEVLIADNGSTDGSITLAEHAGARVVNIQFRGYGAALLGGINAAQGQYIIMGDADDSYDFSALEPFVEKLREGSALVMGNRFKGGIEPGAMPFIHRYLGNPVLSAIGRFLFKTPIGDFHCGLRGFNKDAIQNLSLGTKGMEFASEMVVKASLHGLKIAEVPTTLSPDGRSRAPHLRTWRDGWRHLRFLLLYSPRWLFFYPGLAAMLFGIMLVIWLSDGPKSLMGVELDVHTMFVATQFIIIGYQLALFSAFARVFASTSGLLPETNILKFFRRHATLERGLAAGGMFFIIGLYGIISAAASWGASGFEEVQNMETFRLIIPSGTLLCIGVQTVFSSFLLTFLSVED